MARSQNACFGTFTFQAEGSYDPEMRFTPSYLLNTNWRVDNAKWAFGDGTDSTTTTNYLLHDYSATTDTAVNVCLIVWATDTVNNISCSDTICKQVRLCNLPIASNVVANGVTSNMNFTSYVTAYANGSYPIYQTIDYGDGSAPDSHTFASSSNTLYTHNFPATGTYIVTVTSSNTSGCTKDTSLLVTISQFNACIVNAGYTHTISNDTVILSNTSTPLGAIASYEVVAKSAATGVVYSQASGAFSAINTVVLPLDTVMNVCLIVHDTSGTCKDTICKTITTWQPCAVVSNFTFTQTGSAVLVYNASTGNYPPLTYQWQAPGAWPSSSTATDTAFYYPSLGTQNICLIATNAIGCKDTFCTSITTVPTDTLCGMVFIDANSNGIYDGGEQVRPNSTVRIDGSVFLTDNTGFYRAPVVSGPHVVSLIAPPGWAQTFPDTPLVYNITTNTGDHICGLDFGMRDDTLTLSGIAYLDNNGNGLYDAGDAPRANVPIVINGTNGSATVYTNSAGHYSYAVYSGSYTISSTAPVSHVFTQPYGVNYYNVTAYTASITGLNFGVRNTATTISGKVFIDANNNGVYDLGEIGAANQRVTIGGTYVYTNSLGDWSVIKPAAVYNASYSPTGSYMGYTQTSAANISVNAVTAGGVYPNNNFGIYLAPGTGDVCITLSPSSAPWPFSSSISYSIQLTNYGNIPMPGVLEMNFDPLYTYLASNTAPSSIDQTNYTLRWNLTVAVGQTIYIRPRFTMPNTTPVGVPLFNQAFFAPDAGFVDVNMACNEDTLHQVTVTSYDPNDKYVSPIGQGNNHAINNVGQKLDYTIMFQNTGSAPAVNVILLDTVEADLDIESFVMKDASHDYRVEINGQEIQWTFNNIMLPDSNTSADSSIGFVSFSMKAKQNLAEGTLVTNRAGIYFDYNDVVATGTAFNTIETATSIADIAQGANISIQPNPFNAYTNLVITDGNSQAQYTLRLYDVLGKLVQQVHANTNIIRIERNNMQQGMYMYEVEQDNKLIGKGKLIAE
ncbi:MAG: T9SS type A sorting domain-containing protein [Bacteroidetes bacterium]|nr:T9SS type A sorting domain-containing protein [Bacteroidota bacterium]